MFYELYIDDIFLRSFILDGMVLFITGKICRIYKRTLWQIVAALIGSIGVILTYLFFSQYLWYLVANYAVLQPLVLIVAFGKRRIKQYVQLYGVVLLLEMAGGGCMQWLYHTFFQGRFFLLAEIGTLLVFLFLAEVWLYRKSLDEKIYEIELGVGKQVILLKGFYDTGNLLQDPYTGEPVQLVDTEVIKEALLRNGKKGRMAPFFTLAGKEQWTMLYSIEYMYIHSEKHICIEPAVVGLVEPGVLKGKEYQLIISGHIHI